MLHESVKKKREFQQEFRSYSRKLKLRLSKFSDIPEIYVLKQLIEAEEHNIKAKVVSYKYREEHYSKKVEYIQNALKVLRKTGWKYWYSTCGKHNFVKYIFYVKTPAGQVSWHGTRLSEMKGVPRIQENLWDGQLAVTLPRLLESVYKLCPSILKEPFDKEKLKAEILNNTNRDLNMAKQTTITLGTSAHRFKSSVSVTLDQGVDETLEDIKEVKAKVTKLYYHVLAQELKITQKLNDMDIDKLKTFLKKKLKE